MPIPTDLPPTVSLTCKGCGIVFAKNYREYLKKKRNLWMKDTDFFHSLDCSRSHKRARSRLTPAGRFYTANDDE